MVNDPHDLKGARGAAHVRLTCDIRRSSSPRRSLVEFAVLDRRWRLNLMRMRSALVPSLNLKDSFLLQKYTISS